jgi:hypothetical protein
VLTRHGFCPNYGCSEAGIAQLVEYKLPKLGVASSNLVARSISAFFKKVV